MAIDLHWCKISASGLLQFDGPDARPFLQGQLTNNVQALSASRGQYSGYCTAKGRLLACLLLWQPAQRDDACVMMLPRELCEPIRKRLSMYVLRAKVKVADISAEQVCFGVTGADAATWIAARGGVPAADHDVIHRDGITILKLPVNRYLMVTPAALAATLEAALTQSIAAAPQALWSMLDIEAGIPTVVAATQEQFVPQMVNFDFIGAVSFDKGCYPGQEIVARTHYLGKPKQRMVRALISSPDAPDGPLPGDKLYSSIFGDQASGTIVNAVASDGHHHHVLAVVQTSSIDGADVHWKTVDGPALKIAALPYAIK